MATPLDMNQIRAQFPGLSRQYAGKPAVFADGPAGSQVPVSVAQAITNSLLHLNANHGGCFETSIASDALLHRVHMDAATFLGASDPDCIVFGNNMTSLTFAFSRALARTWQAGDEIILSRCDHDANVTPWVLAAQERNVTIRWIEINPEDCTLNLDSLKEALSKRTKLVAVGMASNAVGTIHPVRQIADLAHAVGSHVFLDAVHYAPHQLMDVPLTGADFVVCSAYKFFGPHVGILWGKREHLERLTPYKVRPAGNELPDCWMTGTQNHEGIAGVGAAIAYLAAMAENGANLRERLVSAYQRIVEHERRLGTRFLDGIGSLKGYRLFGRRNMEGRVATFGITHERLTAAQLSKQLAEEGIFTWAGNFYALPLTEALGLEPEGMLRIGFLHYNTLDEVDRVIDALSRIGE